MRSRLYSPGFESLEARRLLSASHHGHAAAHGQYTGPSIPLVFSGTLTVNNKSPQTTQNADGSTTTSVPVAGHLGSLGEVRGYWNESVDQYGNYIGPDTIRLHTSKGTFVVAFNDGSSGPKQHQGGEVYYQHLQRALGATGAFYGESESGTLDVMMNRSQTLVASIKLQTQKR
jgi:hypothetical protein